MVNKKRILSNIRFILPSHKGTTVDLPDKKADLLKLVEIREFSHALLVSSFFIYLVYI